MDPDSAPRSGACIRSRAAFTFVELMIASAVSLLVVTAVMAYMFFAGFALSGTTAQSMISAQAGTALELIQTRARLATGVSADASGNSLTFWFDNNPAVDSDGDGKAYNDRDRSERFTFLSVTNGTSITNSLIYIPDTTASGSRVLISTGLRKLPNWNVFTVTNGVITLIRFGIMDTYARDHYRSAEIQAAAVPLNRPNVTNIVSILPF